MVELAQKIDAFMELLGFGLFVLLVLGATVYWAGSAIQKRIRTKFWTPEVGDRVILRQSTDYQEGTIKKIDGTRLYVGYFMPNDLAENHKWTDRDSLFFAGRKQKP